MVAISAARIGDIAREQYGARLKRQNKKLLSQRKKPIAPRSSEETSASDVSELDLSSRGLSDIGELNFYTDIKCGSLPRPAADLPRCACRQS